MTGGWWLSKRCAWSAATGNRCCPGRTALAASRSAAALHFELRGPTRAAGEETSGGVASPFSPQNSKNGCHPQVAAHHALPPATAHPVTCGLPVLSWPSFSRLPLYFQVMRLHPPRFTALSLGRQSHFAPSLPGSSESDQLFRIAGVCRVMPVPPLPSRARALVCAAHVFIRKFASANKRPSTARFFC